MGDRDCSCAWVIRVYAHTHISVEPNKCGAPT